LNEPASGIKGVRACLTGTCYSLIIGV
jgi:hypothetical protein